MQKLKRAMLEFTEIVSPAKSERRLLEKDIQTACVTWARKRGYWARKFSSPANRSVPDYLFSHAGKVYVADVGWKFFTEFKAPGKKATDNQIEEQKFMRAAGWDGMQECDDVVKFKNWVVEYEKDHAYLN